MAEDRREDSGAVAALRARHLPLGWWLIALSVLLGLVLETLHGFKLPWYLGPGNETRRLMWTLAHAHGTLLGLLNLGLVATLSALPGPPSRSLRLGARGLAFSSVLLPLGFLLGGVFPFEGDPGWAVFLVPAGGLLLVAATAVLAVEVTRAARRS